MKKILVIFASGLLLLAACAPNQTATSTGPSVEEIVAATMQALTAAAPTPLPPTPQTEGTDISYGNIHFRLPREVANTALAGTVPAVPDEQTGGPWGIAPEYIKFELDGYALFDTFHDARIHVYPASEYAAANESAASSIAKLQAILDGSTAPTPDKLPTIAFFNAGQVFAAQIQTIQFANGKGVRFLTEYAQYFATANNRDLFYQFQGLTDDGKYYIIAILPASHPLLAMSEDPAISIPQGGIPFPGFEDQSGIEAYYPAVVNLLNSAAPNSFTPALGMLDALIQSISIAP